MEKTKKTPVVEDILEELVSATTAQNFTAYVAKNSLSKEEFGALRREMMGAPYKEKLESLREKAMASAPQATRVDRRDVGKRLKKLQKALDDEQKSKASNNKRLVR